MGDHRVRGIKDAEQRFPHGELGQIIDLIDGLPADLAVDEDVSAASLDLLIEKPEKKTRLSAARPSQHDQMLQVVIIGKAHFFPIHRDPEAEARRKGFVR